VSRPACSAIDDIEDCIKLTYSELVASFARLAGHLEDSGIGAGDAVVLLLLPSARLVVATLALLKVGAAWAPLDRKSPNTRLRYLIVGVIDAKLMLTGSEIDIVDVNVPMCLLQRDSTLGQHVPITRSLGNGTHDNILTETRAIFCTSGSTGRPKAVAYSHNTLLHGVLSFKQMCSLQAIDVGLLKSLPSWAVIEYELFPVLISGGLLVVHGQCHGISKSLLRWSRII